MKPGKPGGRPPFGGRGRRGPPGGDGGGKREFRGPKRDFRGPKPDTRGPKRDSRGPKPEFRGPKPEFRGPKRDFRAPKPDFGGPKRDFRGPKPDFGGPKRDFRGPKPEFRGAKPEFRGPKPDFRGPKTGFGGPKRDFRGPKPGFGAPKRDFRGPKPEFGAPKRDFRGPKPEFRGPKPDFRRPKPTRPPAPPPMPHAPGEAVRLHVLIAHAGIASRREAERMIAEGRVTLNGRVVTEPGTKAVPGKDHVKVDGRLVGAEERKIYLLFHKPKGVITAVRDPHGRPVVLDYVKVKERVFPVGRLDWDTEGLLVLTNDGDLAYTLTHPRFEVPRVYQAKVRGVPTDRTLERLREGVNLPDGRAQVTKVRILETTESNAWLEVMVQEGRNRLVKRLLEAVGHPVTKLKRVSYAGLTLGSLRPGESRVLTRDEVEDLLRKAEHFRAKSAGPGELAPPPPGFKPGFPSDSEDEAAEVRAAASEEE